ncbi:MAG: hypothetical protein H6705_20610, partial [Myxococcales bacterium]|nr:hypothetical protein [Myxococcales bacterium]
MQDPRETARWRRVVEALRSEAERLADPRVRAWKLIEIGDVHFDRLGDALAAADAYVEAAGAAPQGADDALRRLERLARESGDGRLMQRWVSGLKHGGRYAEAVALIAARAEGLRDARKRCRLRLEAARLCAEKLGDAPAARRHLIAAAEDAGAPELDRVQRPLAAHLQETPDDEEAAAALARLLARAERPDAAVDVLAAAATHSRDLERKAALLYEAAHLAEQAGAPHRAPPLLYQALVYDPRREAEVRARLDALARRAESGEPALVDALVEVYDALKEPARSQALLARRAGGRGPDRLRQARHAE